VDDGVRIRLEGRLEIVERAAALLELSLPDLRSGQWAFVGHVLDEVDGGQVAAATSAVRAMARTEPELWRAVKRIERARGKVHRTIAAIAARRGLPAGRPRELLDTLASDRVLFETKLTSQFNSMLIPIFGLLALATFITWHHPEGWIAPALIGAFLTVLALVHSGSRYILLTRDRLVVDGTATPIDEIRVVQTDGQAYDRPWPYVMHVRTTGLPRIIRLPWIPPELVDALAECGVEVRRYEWPLEGW
jgi:hypothetical protein